MIAFAKPFAVAATILIMAGAAVAAERGSEAEAKALLDKAVAHYQAVGREQAFKDFADKGGGYIDRDLYVVCQGEDRKIAMHGAIPALVGKGFDALRDADGKPFGTEMQDQALAKGETQVDYKWSNPVSKKIEQKSAFAKKVANGEVCLVGFYK
jgi:hypothetical protein